MLLPIVLALKPPHVLASPHSGQEFVRPLERASRGKGSDDRNRPVSVRPDPVDVQRHRRATCAAWGFAMAGRTYAAIEQNPDKPSRWGQLARTGHQVVRFKDASTKQFVAVAFDGNVTVYNRGE